MNAVLKYYIKKQTTKIIEKLRFNWIKVCKQVGYWSNVTGVFVSW